MSFSTVKQEKRVCISPQNNSKALRFLYGTMIGRILLKPLTAPFASKLGGVFMNSRLSKCLIKGFIKKNQIDMTRYESRTYTSYNDFFTRKILPEKREIDNTPSSFISPCDAKLCAYSISDRQIFWIKGSPYTVYDLLGGNETLANRYENGYCLIFRLAVDDYHRYCYIDNGSKDENHYIKGKFHTVQPIALSRYNIYKQNSREYTVMHTEHFGAVTQIEVGALMVGRIANHHETHAFCKGEEKGMFLFGGSTIVLLVEPGKIVPYRDILYNTENHMETVVKYGEEIGRAM